MFTSQSRLNFVPVERNLQAKNNQGYVVVIDQILAIDDLIENDTNMEVPMRKTKNGMKLNKCSQCDYVSSNASALKTHLKMHIGEKSNKCNQCDFASSEASKLRRHLTTHSGEKSNTCNQCDFASSQAGNLQRHLKTHSGNSL